MKKLLLLFVLCCLSMSISAQEEPSPILFIYDASGSMWGQLDGKTKKEIAAEVLSTSVNQLPENQHIGLMAYGHRRKGDCDDIEFLAQMDNASKNNITSTVKEMNAIGKTPLARSATMAIDVLKERKIRATIILITDGIESCDGDLCNVISNAKAAGIDFKLHVVGFGLKDAETAPLKCAAEAGGGKYYDAANANDLTEGLTEATNQTIDDPAGNFSIYASKNDEPVDAVVEARKVGSKLVVDGARTYQDSAWLFLPPGEYDITIRPLEGTDIPGTSIRVGVKEGEVHHRDVGFDGGTLEVMTSNNGEGWDATVKMKDMTTGKVVASMRTYGKPKTMEVPAGKYLVVMQVLKIKGKEIAIEMDDVVISSNATTQISHDFKSGVAMIGVQTSTGELIDATVNFYEASSNKHITGSRTYTSENSNPRKFLLTPGTYKVKLSAVGAHKGNKKEFIVEVKAGETVTKTITF